MAVRLRSDGAVVCAAMHPVQEGDCYIDDELHYRLSAELGLLVSEPMEKHQHDGLWWWHHRVPEDRMPASYYAACRTDPTTEEEG